MKHTYRAGRAVGTGVPGINRTYPLSAAARDIYYGFDDDIELAVKSIDEPGIAILFSDRTRLRYTPSGERTADQILQVGDIIKTSYNTGPYTITKIVKIMYYGLPTISMILSQEGDRTNSYINEVVAVSGRLLKLFETNDDEIFIVKKAKQLEFYLT